MKCNTWESGEVSFHEKLFLFTVLYLVLESMRGVFILGDLRVGRWIAYYLVFGIILLLMRRWHFSIPPLTHIAKTVGISSSLYFATYLGFGLFAECVNAIPRWSQQGVRWAGSSYALFLLVISLPVAFLLLHKDDKPSRRIGWSAIVVSILAIGYYDSRIGWLALTGFSFLTPLVFGLRRGLVVFAGVICISISVFILSQSVLATPRCKTILKREELLKQTSKDLLDVSRYKERAASFSKGMTDTVVAPIAPRVSDIDRGLHLRAGLLAMKESPLHFLLGSGTYTHKKLLHPYLEKLFSEKLPGVQVPRITRTVGLTAIIVDFGFFGLVLLALNFLITARTFIINRSWAELRIVSMFLFALVLVPLWLVISNIQDIVVFFWLFMPENPFTFFSTYGKSSFMREAQEH